MGGQIYGKEYSFPMITPKLIFSLIALSVHFHSGGGAAFPTKGEGLGMWKGKEGKGYLVYLYLFALDFPTSDNPVSENPISGYPVSGFPISGKFACDSLGKLP